MNATLQSASKRTKQAKGSSRKKASARPAARATRGRSNTVAAHDRESATETSPRNATKESASQSIQQTKILQTPSVVQPPPDPTQAPVKRRPIVQEPPAAAESPKTRADILVDLSRRAGAGDRQSLLELRQILDAHPDVWRVIGDVAAAAERVWIDRLGYGSALRQQSLLRKLAEMKSELLGEHASPLERLLVDAVAVSWLALADGEMAAADSGGSIKQAALRLRRAESGSRRFLASVGKLALVRRLLPPRAASESPKTERSVPTASGTDAVSHD